MVSGPSGKLNPIQPLFDACYHVQFRQLNSKGIHNVPCDDVPANVRCICELPWPRTGMVKMKAVRRYLYEASSSQSCP